MRGFLSTAAKKHGLKIESTKSEVGDRICDVPVLLNRPTRLRCGKRKNGGRKERRVI